MADESVPDEIAELRREVARIGVKLDVLDLIANVVALRMPEEARANARKLALSVFEQGETRKIFAKHETFELEFRRALDRLFG